MTPTSEVPETPEAPSAESTAITCSKPVFLIVVSLVALVALLVSLFETYQVFQTTQKIAALQTEVDNNQQRIDQQTDLESRIQQIDTRLKDALKQTNYQNQDWVLLKAKYYLELAQVNEHWSEDKATTLALMQQADTLLKPLKGQVNLLTLRQTIAKEIARIEANSTQDVAGILSQLDALKDELMTLALRPRFTPPKTTDPTPNSYFQQSLNQLKQLVVIRRTDETADTLLSPMHETLIRDRLQSEIQIAEWALIQHNENVYQLSLQRLAKEIEKYFDKTTAAYQSFIQQLTKLQQISFEAPQTSIQKSLIQLNELINASNHEEAL